MTPSQHLFLLAFALFNLLVSLKGFYESKHKKNAFGLTRPLVIIGVFVWADAVVFGPFWTAASLLAFVLQDWYLFLLITSIFWVVRSLGEVIYWLDQQFSTLKRNPIENLPWQSIFHNDSVWFVHQIIWQCVMVISLVLTIYFSHMWLQTFPN